MGVLRHGERIRRGFYVCRMIVEAGVVVLLLGVVRELLRVLCAKFNGHMPRPKRAISKTAASLPRMPSRNTSGTG